MPISASVMPSIEFLRSQLDYDPKSGALTWKVSKKGHTKAGDPAGCKHTKGYLAIGLNGRSYLAHRLAWFMFYGELSETDQIDHINLDRTDNRIENLRKASHEENCRNTGCRSHSRTGLKGTRYDKRANKYASRITINGKQVWLGYFKTAEEAHAAYCKKAEELHGEFFRPKAS